MSSKELTLTAKEELFVMALLDNGGNVREAAKVAGYADVNYGYAVRKRLAKYIAQGVKDFLTVNGAARAANGLINMMDEDNPNPVKLNTYKDILDRTGVKHHEEQQQPSVKQNIFILPEKEYKVIIDNNEQ